jgi:hypothetical protein
MPANVYDQHRASFAQVSAYVILNQEGRNLGKIALKFPRDGAGRLLAYVHFLGEPMVRGFAGGYGYDKASASIADAARKMTASLPEGCYADGTPHYTSEERAEYARLVAAMREDSGSHWDSALRAAGFRVLQAV